MAQAGIRKDWLAPGTVTLYGEYGLGFGDVRVSVPGLPGSDDTRTGSYIGVGVEVIVPWGQGVVQSVDAAAMALYVQYRHYDLGTEIAQLGGPVPVKVTFDDWKVGGRIKF
jgi:opacity protein-like surface antigen